MNENFIVFIYVLPHNLKKVLLKVNKWTKESLKNHRIDVKEIRRVLIVFKIIWLNQK